MSVKCADFELANRTGMCEKRRVSLPNPPLSSRGWDRCDISIHARVLNKLVGVVVEFQLRLSLGRFKDVRNPNREEKTPQQLASSSLSHCHGAPLLRIFMEKEELSRYSITADVNGRGSRGNRGHT